MLICVYCYTLCFTNTQHVYTITGGSCHRYYFCRDKSVVVTSLLLSWQHVFVTTKHVFCHNKSMLATTKLLSRQNYVLPWQTHAKVNLSGQNFCQDNIMLVATNVCLDKTFVTTKICLSRQTFYHEKHTFVTTKDVFCWDKHVHMFVTTNTCLSWQNCFHDKRILMATPTCDSLHYTW